MPIERGAGAVPVLGAENGLFPFPVLPQTAIICIPCLLISSCFIRLVQDIIDAGKKADEIAFHPPGLSAYYIYQKIILKLLLFQKLSGGILVVVIERKSVGIGGEIAGAG